MSAEKEDEAVRETNDSATSNKFVCVSKGYFADSYIPLFSVKPSKPPTPLMNRGYWSRVVAVEKMINWFLGADLGEGRKQVVNLGAGFDTTFFRLLEQKKLENVHWLELDFPAVVAKKKKVLTRSQKILDLFQKQGVVLAGGEKEKEKGGIVYQITETDLRSFESQLQTQLSSSLDPSLPTLFVSECVLAYLDAADGTKVINWTAATYPTSFFVTYEQILPDDSFGKMMIHNLHSRGCDLRSIRDFPNLEAQKARYTANGWGTVFAMDMFDYYNQEIEAEERKRAEKLEWLDELEEWVLIQRHYCIVCAVRDSSLVEKTGFCPPMKTK